MNPTASARRNSRGFTLVELCAGLGICAALAGQAVPAMGKLKQEQPCVPAPKPSPAICASPAARQPPMRLRSNAEMLEFHRRGLVTQTGSIEVSLDNGAGIRQLVAITGRVRNWHTTTKPAGMPRCS